MRKYQIIYADPPWKYSNASHRPTGKYKFRGGAKRHYDTMTTEDICNLPISELADENCFLFIWATFPNLREVFKVIDSWGFQYRTLGFSWIKTNKKNNKPFFGIGFYTKSNCEICLIATKGKPKVISNSVSSVVISPLEGHSKKPDIIRSKIIQLAGNLPRIELFARPTKTLFTNMDGWDVWGNEVENDINLLKEPTPQDEK